MKKNEHHRYLMGQHESLKKEPRRSWKKAKLEHHTSQRNLLVIRRRSREQEEHRRSQKNLLVLHMSSKERLVCHKSQRRLMVHHMS